MIALYLDENVSLLVATVLSNEHFVVVSAHEVGMIGANDEEQLQYAAAHGRVLLIFNQKHFRPLYDTWWSAGQSHNGIILSREYKKDEIADLLQLIRNLLTQASPDDLRNSLVYLQQYSWERF